MSKSLFLRQAPPRTSRGLCRAYSGPTKYNQPILPFVLCYPYFYPQFYSTFPPIHTSIWPLTARLYALHTIRHDNSFSHLTYKISTYCSTLAFLSSRYFSFTIALSSSLTTMGKTCKTGDPPAYTTIESTAQNLQPFYPSCLTKYPNALKFYREINDLYCMAVKPVTCTCHPTLCYRHTTARPSEKYFFTDFKYDGGTVS